MTQILRVEVELLSEQRWERVERALMDRLEPGTLGSIGEPRARRRGLRPLLAAAALLAGLTVWVLAASMGQGAQEFDHPSRIITGRSPSHLALPGLALEVQPESAVTVGTETSEGQLVVLDSGSVVCQVAPRKSDAPLVVQAGGVRVRVVGTRFSVSRLGDSARVRVYEGVVEVSTGTDSLRLRAGDEWPPRVVERPKTKVTEVPDPEHAARPGAAFRNGAASSTAGATKQKAVVAAAPPRQSSQDVFEQATTLESRDPGRASKLYEKLEAGSDSWAQNALYARGRLEASRGNAGEARRLLERYLERFPRGSNAEDARAVLRSFR